MRFTKNYFYKTVELCKSIAPKHDFKFDNPLYSFDASTIDLCLSAFPWAKFRVSKGAFKLHCLYNHSGNIPEFIRMTDAKVADITVAKDELSVIPDSIPRH